MFLFCSFFMSFFRTWRYVVLLHANDQSPSSVALYLVTLVRNLFSDLLPARIGTVVYIYLVKYRLGVCFGSATASFAMAFVFDILSLAFLIFLAAIIVSASSLSTPVLIGVGVFLIICSVLVLLFLPQLIEFSGLVAGYCPFVGVDNRLKLKLALESTRDGILKIQKARVFLKVLALSFGVRLFKYLSLYVLLLALLIPAGYEAISLGLPKVFLGLCSAELAASLPISGIAGFGAYEGAWILVFQLLGYSHKLAMVSSVSHHVFTQVYGYSIGSLALLLLWLPQFHEKGERVVLGSTEKPFFWLRFLAVFLLGLVIVISIYPATIAWLKGEKTSINLSSSMRTFSEAKHHARDMVRGWVVYQRPDGVYKVEVGERKEIKLSSFGTAPRWSPDGKHIVFFNVQDIMIMRENGEKLRKIVESVKGKAVCFNPLGNAVLFTDGNFIRQVQLKSGRVETLVKGHLFRELDVSQDGKTLAVSVKTPLGIQVRLIDLATGKQKKVAQGCSASISPNSKYVTVNGKRHRFLNLYSFDTLTIAGRISAPKGYRFDNQTWSNHAHWLVSKSEGDGGNIYIHHLPSDRSYQVTFSAHCDRPDFFVSRNMF